MTTKKLVIDRARWLRGNKDSKMLSNGKMCCLGFYALQIDCVKALDILEEGDPSGCNLPKDSMLVKRIHNGTERYMIQNTLFTDKAINLNDEEEISDETREALLISLFAQNGIELSFVDE